MLDIDALYFSEDGRRIKKISLEDGHRLWESEQLAGRGDDDISVQLQEGSVIISSTSSVSAVDAVTGLTLWQGATPESPHFVARILSRSYVVAVDVPGEKVEAGATAYFYDHNGASGLIPRNGGAAKLGRLSDVRSVMAADGVLLVQTASAIRDPAYTFFARGAKGLITGISAIHDLVVTTDVLDAFLNTHLDINALERWARGKSQRLEQLADLAGTVTTSDAEPGNVQDVTRTLESLDRIDDKLLSTLQALLSRTNDSKQRGVLLRALMNTAEGLAQAQSELNDRSTIIVDDLEKLLNDPSATQTDLKQFFKNHPWLLATPTRLHLFLATHSRDGLAETGRVFGNRIADRLESARQEAKEYSRLIRDTSSTETDLQRFIQEHPWLIGLEYANVRPKQPVLRGEMDFFLERFDGFHDILELKDPQDPIIKAADAVNARPPPPHDSTLSPALAQALAQSHGYREQLTMGEHSMERLYGLKRTRNPRILILIGKASSLTPDRRSILEQLNLSLHRVEIIPYDLLGERARTILANVDKYMGSQNEHRP